MISSELLRRPSRPIPAAVQNLLLRAAPLSCAAAKLYAVDPDNADVRKISSLISTDPALAALVLRIANSPLFAFRQQVTGILHAIAVLGLKRLRALAATAALRMLVNPATAPEV
jgi:HD-like signal output (HDOD) protein